MGDAAMDLAVYDQRIDQRSGVLQRHVTQDADLAGLGVHLDLSGMARVGISARIGADITGVLLPLLHAGRKPITRRDLPYEVELAQLLVLLVGACDTHIII